MKTNKWINVEDKLPPLNTKVLVYYYESGNENDPTPCLEGEEIGQLISEDEHGYHEWVFKTGWLGGGEVKKWKKLI